MTSTAVTREAHKQRHDRSLLDALLDEVHIAHVGVCDASGSPVVIPTASARDGDTLLLHGSTGSPWMRRLTAGAPASVAITAYDGIVVARSAFESSVLYRSAVLFGACTAITDTDAKLRALDLLTEALIPGRVAEVRRPLPKELAATVVLALPIDRWSLKISDGWPADGDEDVAGPAWGGVVRARTAYSLPEPAPDLRDGIAVSPAAAALR